MRRRDALAAGGALVGSLSVLPTALTAGCLDRQTLRREDAWRELVVYPLDIVTLVGRYSDN
ncbi:beta-galactosidase precursor [Natrialba magadii ATCC 43099]|uniref:Beta-galactosidase n=1 Tax=Natrialba magadii (strain ATCC 43099 / DSM 3394 / CCM 3739 / CIP 104546 / IAM 13178 / JCM 8861 / NBRC 102185 / NCIMB 2190 / MS3) TaxID=547559 RepID=D3SXR1_NATMM|nr:hypothetical protein [Natrialba magadii]ADD06010.1 beta-galactosidase precursor [Natrialba magadii ATCC 43099]ELY30481.1 beta-galactosidase [Natrialba magadii ATCC 43099]